jgi:hypothetical protein
MFAECAVGEKMDLKEKDVPMGWCSFMLRAGHGQPLGRFDSPGLLSFCCLAAKKDLGEGMSAAIHPRPDYCSWETVLLDDEDK